MINKTIHTKTLACFFVLALGNHCFSQSENPPEKKNEWRIFIGPGIQFGFDDKEILTQPATGIRFDLRNNIHVTKSLSTAWLEAGLAYKKGYLHIGYSLPEKNSFVLTGIESFSSHFKSQRIYADLGMSVVRWGQKNEVVAAMNCLYVNHENEAAYKRVMQPIIDQWDINYQARAFNFGLKLMYRKQLPNNIQLDIFAVQPIAALVSVDYDYTTRYEYSPGSQPSTFAESKTNKKDGFLWDPKVRNLLQFGLRISYSFGLN